MIVDMVFSISGHSIPRDHGFMLWRGLRACLPWLSEETDLGIHAIRGAPGNDDMLLLTQRASLVLRLPETRLADVQSLSGRQLDLDGHTLQIGSTRQRPLQAFATLYSPLVCTGNEDELDFLDVIAAQLKQMNVTCKFMCGKQRSLRAEQAVIRGYSLMLHGLGADQSLLLQQTGVGEHRKLGCGILVPHKSIAAVAA